MDAIPAVIYHLWDVESFRDPYQQRYKKTLSLSSSQIVDFHSLIDALVITILS
jgi:hypothetical protein